MLKYRGEGRDCVGSMNHVHEHGKKVPVNAVEEEANVTPNAHVNHRLLS